MTTFLAGVVLALVPGLITGSICWSVVGAFMNRYRCRHLVSAPTGATASISAVTERLRTDTPIILSATRVDRPAIPQVIVLPVLMPPATPQQALPQWSPRVPTIIQEPEQN